MSTNNLMSVRAFAQQMGVSHTTIQNTIRDGRLVKGVAENGKIIPEIAKKEFLDNGVGYSNNNQGFEAKQNVNQNCSVSMQKQDKENERYGDGIVWPDGLDKKKIYLFQKYSRLYLRELVSILVDIFTDLPDVQRNLIDQADTPEWFFDAMDERLTDFLRERRSLLLEKCKNE